MSDEAVFALASSAPLVGWAALLLAPLARSRVVVFARVVAVALAVGYLVLVGVALARPAGPMPDFTTLAGLAAAFSDPRVTLIGWFHFLALDLWAGAWEAEDAGTSGVPHAALVPSLLLTLLAGPAGLLLYLLLRSATRSRR